jgi:hypothetical protein
MLTRQVKKSWTICGPSSLATSKMRPFKSSPSTAGSPPATMPPCRPEKWPSPVYAVLASTQGHHRLTFEAARLALGAPAARPVDFFEACRRKRNVIDYDHAPVATHTEAEEIVAEANNFFELVDRWIAANHPQFAS